MIKPRVLIVDDEKMLRGILTTVLDEAGYDVLAVESGEAAVGRAPDFEPDVALIDLRLTGIDGVETMERLRDALGPATPVFIIMTAHGTIRSAVDAIRRGALDYVTKPFDNDELKLTVLRAVQMRRLERRVEVLESQLDERFRPENMVGQSGAMDAVFRMIGKIAPLDTTVLISGETGTGKELVARAIHRHSNRKDAPFVTVNCGAIPPTLIESSFFGHERGAFTDAKTARRGAFEQANAGTLFLDEVAELSAAAQAGLLRALEEGEIRRVGGERAIPVDVRFIAATNRDLKAEVEAGTFREDLFWRLNVVAVHLPALRERPEDIAPLADHFLRKHAGRLGLAPLPLDPDALSLLIAYDWPGNVRELENALESSLALAAGPSVTATDLPARLRGPGAAETAHPSAAGGAPQTTLSEAVERARVAVEERMILDALRETGGNRTRAAERLGISRKTLFNKMRELGL
ncbi:MAG: sigma-54 dependent transcriptional regulator [Gemmatimonadales bacterium]|jgi:DNA-binding NtrC family response regulator